MKILKLNLNSLKDSIDAIEEAVGALRDGGSIIYPTDTIYGLGVDATNVEAVSRLFDIKKRSRTKPVPVIVSSIEMARRVAYINKKKEEMLQRIWSTSFMGGLGPVTVVLQKKDILPDILTGGNNTVGIRIPRFELARILVLSLGLPITATSANISGEEPSLDIESITKRFIREDNRPDLILDAGILPASEPSTVLDLSGGEPKILRVGPVSKKQLFDILS